MNLGHKNQNLHKKRHYVFKQFPQKTTPETLISGVADKCRLSVEIILFLSLSLFGVFLKQLLLHVGRHELIGSKLHGE